MIQALKNKIRDTEYVSEVLKEELLKSVGSGGSMEEINEMIIRKTLGGYYLYNILFKIKWFVSLLIRFRWYNNSTFS